MSFNLVVWAWSHDYDTTAKRRRKKLKYDDVLQGFWEDEDHPAMGVFDFSEFESAVKKELGPERPEGPYILERYPRALCFSIPNSGVPEVVTRIGGLARRFGLTQAGR